MWGSHLQGQRPNDLPFDDAMNHLTGAQNACKTAEQNRGGTGSGRSEGGTREARLR